MWRWCGHGALLAAAARASTATLPRRSIVPHDSRAQFARALTIRVAVHPAQADEAFHIGPSPSAQSYLRADTIISVAKSTGAQAIHPGYGFLSENEAFSRSCGENGIVFVGPPDKAIREMGSKAASKVCVGPSFCTW